MRVIKAQDLEAALSSFAPDAEVIFGVDFETVGIGGDVSRPRALDNHLAGALRANQQAAALGRGGLACVSDDVVVGGSPKTDTAHTSHSASTATLMPMPPPMHSAATP